eukprot:1308388-Pyramimonas_sp.AAC.1
MATGAWPATNRQNLPLDGERALKRGFDLAGGWMGCSHGDKNAKRPCSFCDIEKKDPVCHPATLDDVTWTRKDAN